MFNPVHGAYAKIYFTHEYDYLGIEFEPGGCNEEVVYYLNI